MIEVTLPDGSVIEFPEGTPEATINNVIRTMTGGKPDPRQAMKDRIAAAKAGTLTVSPESAARAAQADQIAQDQLTLSGAGPILPAVTKFAQGIPFIGEYSDEFTGFVDRATGGTGAAGDQQRAVQDAMARQHPGWSTAYGIAGGIAGSAGLAKLAGAGYGLLSRGLGAVGVTAPSAGAIGSAIASRIPSSLAGRVVGGGLLGAGGGALEGAVSGYGAGVGDGRLSSAADRAASGLVLGGLIGTGAPLAADTVKWLVQRFKGSDVRTIADTLNISTDAAKSFKGFIEADDLEGAQRALQMAGDDAMLADAGGGFTQMLDTSMQSGGAAARIGREAVDSRAVAADARMTGVLDDTLGAPEGVNTAKSGIRASTAADRQALYDDAFNVEIDWRSPEGEQLRGLLQTTPDDVLARAARNRAMKARAPAIPDAAYADEFAPDVSVRPGPAAVAADDAEAQAVNSFFDLYGQMPRSFGKKRPLTATIKNMGGVQPNSPLAAELRANGITPKTVPGLFNRNGMYDVDNLDPSYFPDSMAGSVDGNYMGRQAIIDALVSENQGVPVRSVAEDMAARDWDGMDEALPQFEARRDALNARLMAPEAPPPVSDIVPMKTVYDIDQIKRALDEIKRTNDGQGLLGGQTEYGVEAGKRAREIRDLLAQISDPYREALAVSSDTITRVQGVDFGAKLLNPNVWREQVAEVVDGAMPPELAAIRQGLRSQIDETLANVKSKISNPNADINEVTKLWENLSSKASRDKIRMIVGPTEAERLFAEIDRAGIELGTRAAVARNSATASRQAGQRVVDTVVDGGLKSQLGDLRGIEAARRVFQVMLGNTPEAKLAQKQGIYAELARALTTKRGQEAQDALRIVKKAMEGQPVSSAEAARVARTVTGGLALGGYQAGSQYQATQQRAMLPR